MAVKLQFSQQPKLVLVLRDSLIAVKRSSTHIIRNTDQLLGTFFQPIMFLVLFSAVYSGAIAASLPPGVSYLQFLMAGIIVQTLAFGSTTTAIAVANDLKQGIVDRFRSLPMSKIAVLNGHVVSDLFRNGLSTVVMILTGLVIGFRTSASFIDWLLITLIVLLFTLAFSWIAAILGVIAKSVEGVQWLTFVIIFPLTFASSAFVPAETMNQYLRGFAENQPIAVVIDAVRGLMLGSANASDIWWAIAWCVGTIIVAMPIAAWLFKRKVTS